MGHIVRLPNSANVANLCIFGLPVLNIWLNALFEAYTCIVDDILKLMCMVLLYDHIVKLQTLGYMHASYSELVQSCNGQPSYCVVPFASALNLFGHFINPHQHTQAAYVSDMFPTSRQLSRFDK